MNKTDLIFATIFKFTSLPSKVTRTFTRVLFRSCAKTRSLIAVAPGLSVIVARFTKRQLLKPYPKFLAISFCWFYDLDLEHYFERSILLDRYVDRVSLGQYVIANWFRCVVREVKGLVLSLAIVIE